MKYYIGQLLVHHEEYDSTTSYCVCAAGDKEAQELLRQAALRFAPGGHGPDERGDFRYDGAEVLQVSVRGMKEVSFVTFSEAREVFQALGDDKHVRLEEESALEQSKTLARRIGAQLEKLGAKVPHTKLLHAVAASLGHTDFATLRSKEKGKGRETSTLPTGNWPTSALRAASDLSLAARVDALWLTHGDVELAARLLHVDPDALLASFDAETADVAFCSRPATWSPEDSLALNYGVRSEQGHSFEVRVARTPPSNVAEVEGYINGRSVVSLSNKIGQRWLVGSSTCMPSDLHAAMKMLACYEAVFHKALELRGTDFPEPEPELIVTYD